MICNACGESCYEGRTLTGGVIECRACSAGRLAAEGLHREQPAPKSNDLPAVWDLVVADMVRRDALGEKRYGVRLQPHNGRDALRDAFEEALDLCVYLRQALYERDGR